MLRILIILQVFLLPFFILADDPPKDANPADAKKPDNGGGFFSNLFGGKDAKDNKDAAAASGNPDANNQGMGMMTWIIIGVVILVLIVGIFLLVKFFKK